MNDITSMLIYLNTPMDAMRRLDDERFRAEQFCTDGRVWAELARRYYAQGRPCQAASCERRANYYANVAVETVVEVAYGA
jgi:hypothetical protein